MGEIDNIEMSKVYMPQKLYHYTTMKRQLNHLQNRTSIGQYTNVNTFRKSNTYIEVSTIIDSIINLICKIFYCFVY
jgi:hypothetical protein